MSGIYVVLVSNKKVLQINCQKKVLNKVSFEGTGDAVFPKVTSYFKNKECDGKLYKHIQHRQRITNTTTKVQKYICKPTRNSTLYE